MPFLLYEKRNINGERAYERVKEIKGFGGKNGPIRSCLEDEFVACAGDNCEWHLTAGQLLEAMGYPGGNYSIVIDLKPSKKKEVNLYELKEMWGYSYRFWTPIALRLESLFRDIETRSERETEKIKLGFKEDDIRERKNVFEFLYLQKGTKKGTWNWGPIGAVNGALLFEGEAFEYFFKTALKKYL